jgi:hypothetical protein
VALFGTQIPLLIPGKIRVNVGPPMFISHHLADGLDATAAQFKDALESAVKALLMESIRAQGDRS